MGKMEDIDLVNYIINQEATGKEAAEYFDVSLSTVRKRLAGIKENLSSNSSIYEELEEVAKKNEQMGKVVGGKSPNSGPKRILQVEDIVKIAMDMLVNNFTIQEASLKYGIPGSTLAENLEVLKVGEYNEIYQDLSSLFQAHKLKRNSTKIQTKYLEKMQELEEVKKK